MMCSSLQQGPRVVLLHRCFSPGQTLPLRQQSSYRPKQYVQRGCRVWHCSTTITHFLATIAQYKLRTFQVTGNLPEHHEASSAKSSPAKQKHRCHCFSLEPSKTHLHTRHRGSNMAATYTVRYHANAHCKLLLYKLASCGKRKVKLQSNVA